MGEGVNWHEANHPVWSIIRLVVILASMTWILWMNADHFDDTEIKTILTMFFALVGVEGITKVFTKS